MVGLFVGLAPTAGCAPRGEGQPGTPPHILLISLDALRADHLGAYGYARDTSPFLDELAASGVRFENAFINCLGTTPSHTTILSSLYQETHGMDYERSKAGTIVPIPAGARMIQEVLSEAGYATVAVTGGGNTHERFGFDRGFDHYDSGARSIDKGVRRLLAALPESFDRPTFVFFHTYEIHSPYRPPAEYREMFGRFESDLWPTSEVLLDLNRRGTASELTQDDFAFLVGRYDGGIRYVDDTLRTLFAELDLRGFFENYLVVITSDHGEEFGEHGHFVHQGYLYEELLKVPLIFAGDRIPRGEVPQGLVSTIDIAPTVFAYSGIDAPPGSVGRDLFGFDREPREIFAQFGPRRYAVRTERFKLIENTGHRTLELYDLESDPGELENLARQKPETAARLHRLLSDFRKEHAPLPREATTLPIDPEHRERLRALGYL